MAEAKNHLSTEQVRVIDALTKLSPRQWEKKCEQILRANGFSVWRDEDRPSSHAGANAMRRAGFPDFIARRFRAGECEMVLLEAKTGRAVLTGAQREWIEAAEATPGMRGIVARPADFFEVCRELGGIEPE